MASFPRDERGGDEPLPRLKSLLQVQAMTRRHDRAAIPATVVRKGDADSGAILVKVNQHRLGCTVLTQARSVTGELVWMRGTGAALVDEAAADAYIARQAGRDPDLWVVEIESPDGRILIDGTIA